jgi:hypothetical protein
MRERFFLGAVTAAGLASLALLSGCADRAEAGQGRFPNGIDSNAVAVEIPAEPAEVVAPRTYLLSIAGIALGPHEYVDGFSVDTWGVDFLAVCHFPPGWTIRAGRQASPDGVLAGEASHGATFLDRAWLRELRGLALVRIFGRVQPIRTGSIPATFAGRATIGSYGVNGEPSRRAMLGARNIRLVPAARCPDPED